MNTKIIKTISIILLAFSFGAAQKKSDTPIMQYWNGGKLNFSYSQGINSSVGIGSGSGFLGGIISPNSNYGASAIFSNPAELGYLKISNMLVEARFNAGISNVIQASDIRKKTTDILKDTATFVFSSGNYRKDTEVSDQYLGQMGSFTALTGAFPIANSFVVFGGYSMPLDFNLNLLVNGVSTSLNTVKRVSDNDTRIDIIMNPAIQAITKIQANRISFGAAKELMDNKNGKLAFGFSVNRYDMRSYVDVKVDIAGVVVLNNLNEYYFNNPTDQNLNGEETNNLYIRINGNYKAEKYGYTIGANYDAKKLDSWLSRFNFSLVFNYNPNFDLIDNSAYYLSYQPRFIKGRYDGKGDEKLDVIVDSIDLSKPNLTKRTYNPFSQEMNIKMPSSLTVGIDTRLGEHSISLNVMKYFSELSYKFDKYKVGKNLNAGIKLGGDFVMPYDYSGWGWAYMVLRVLYLDFDGLLMQAFSKQTQFENLHYRVYGGISFGNSIVEGIDDPSTKKSVKDLMDLPLPAEFAMCRQYTILKKVNVGVLVAGFPDLFMRFSLGYNL